MNEFTMFTLIAIGSVLVSSASQMMLKISAGRLYETKVKEYLNPLVIGAYVLFFGSTLIMVIAYKVIPLSLGPIIEALGYVFIAAIGFMILKEKLTFKKLIGMILIIIGVLLSSLA